MVLSLSQSLTGSLGLCVFYYCTGCPFRFYHRFVNSGPRGDNLFVWIYPDRLYACGSYLPRFGIADENGRKRSVVDGEGSFQGGSFSRISSRIPNLTATLSFSVRIICPFQVNGVKRTDPSELVTRRNVVLNNSHDLSLICWGKRNFSLVQWIE